MMRTEAFKKRIVKGMRNPIGGHIYPQSTADYIRRLPITSKDKAAKATLVKELLNIDKQLHDLYRRYSRAADALERLSVGRALMRRPGE